MTEGRHPVVVGVACTLVLAALLAGHRSGALPIDTLGDLERSSLDFRFQLRGPRPATGKVVIVTFDDKTLSENARLFERREGWAEVIRATRAASVSVLGIDAYFSDPEELLSPDLSRDVRAFARAAGDAGPPTLAEALITRVYDEIRGDELLADTLRDAGRVVLGLHVGQGGRAPSDGLLRRSTFGQVVPGPSLPAEYERVAASLPSFIDAASGLGLITALEDPDGRVRSIPAGRGLQKKIVMPMAVQLVATHEGVGRGRIALLGNRGALRVGDREVPTDRANLLLNPRGPAGTIPTYSAVDVVTGAVGASELDGRIALLGVSHLAQDRATTSFGARVPGVEVQATAVDNLLAGDPLRRAPAWYDIVLTLLCGLFITALFIPRLNLSPVAEVVGALLVVLGALAASAGALAFANLWLAFAGPAIVGVAVTGGCFASAYLEEGLRRRRLRKTFSHYLSDAVIDELIEDPTRLSLSSERRELSVLFSDIRGFTALSEKMPALELASLLHAYFNPMTRAVMGAGGFLDKFIGDAIMAVFGAPVHHARHATEACDAALRMHLALTELVPEVRARWGVDLAIGVGVNTGEMVVGNLGSSERFDYTVLGDAVNLASRIEGLTKTYGVFCLVGEPTRALVDDGFSFRSVDLVRVKGKDHPSEIFELLAGPGHTVATYESLDDYRAGVSAYRAGDFEGAGERLRAFMRANPHDVVAALLLDRMTALEMTAPPGWDGVFTHESK